MRGLTATTLCMVTSFVFRAAGQQGPAQAIPKQARPAVISPNLESCNEHPQGTRAGSECLDKTLKKLDSELNGKYAKALSKLPLEESDIRFTQDQLRKSQRAWLKYVDENCSLVGALDVWGGTTNSITYHSLLCRVQSYTERIEFLDLIGEQGKREP